MFEVTHTKIAFNALPECKNHYCYICRNHLTEACIECESKNLSDCISIKGKCGHAYHAHCIAQWCKTHPSCPLDNTRWDPLKTK